MSLWHVDRGRPCVVLDQDPPHPIDEVGEKRQIDHLRTNIIVQSIHLAPAPNAAVDNDKR
jgi:hypothetical protein